MYLKDNPKSTAASIRTARQWPPAEPTKQVSKTAVHKRATSAPTSNTSVPVGTPAVDTSPTVGAPGLTDIILPPASAVQLRLPNVVSSSTGMPLIPIPPPPPLATSGALSTKRHPSNAKRISSPRPRVSASPKQGVTDRQVGQRQLRQPEVNAVATSAVMPP